MRLSIGRGLGVHALSMLLVVLGGAVPAPASGVAEPARILHLKVVGTRLLNSRGEPVWLRGVNTACLEWTSDGEGHILDTVRAAIQDWKVNHIRLPLAQDRWFGKAPEQKDGGRAYRALVKQIVDYCASRNCYVMLDLHWSDAGEWGKQIGQHVMPDRNSVEFWRSCARAYRNNPAVIFDLYNEPHDVTWDVWLKGGTVTENDRQRGYRSTFEAVGMQTLLDTVRAAGARNLVVAGGLDWAYDMSGFLEGKQLADPRGNGVLYANHNYPMKGDTHAQWLAKMTRAAERIPIIVSEFGAGGFGRRRPGQGDAWVRQVLEAVQVNKWHWTAWDMHPAAGPTLISDWNYTPTPGFGVYVKQALEGTLPPYTPPADTATAPPAGPPVPQVAPDVLNRGIQALGGEEQLARVKAATWTAQARLHVGGQESASTIRVTVQGLDRMRQEFEGEFGGNKVRGVTVLSGDKGMRIFGGNRADLRADELVNERRSAYLTVIPMLLVPLRDRGWSLQSVTDAAVDGKPAAGVRVTAPDRRVFTLYFDKESSLPVRLVAAVAGFMGDEAEQETVFSDYRPVGSIRKAMKVVVRRDGEPFMEQQITEFRVLDKVDATVFDLRP